MAKKTFKVETVGQALLEILRERGIECLIGNAFTSIIDGLSKFEAEGKSTLRPVMTPHEQTAVTMAHGFYAVTGRPQAAIVYSTPGTANIAGALVNASKAQIPLIVLAASSALTDDGSMRGARDIHVQWAQESFDQAGMIREYVKWDYELRQPAQLESVINRALEMAMDQPRGPVYISLPRDVIAEALTAVTINTPARREVANQRHPDPARLQEAAKILAESKSPLIITSELGRSALAVAGLVELADAGAIEVIEASPVYANFPADHPCHAGYVFGSAIHPAIAKADALLVIDCDVPWFPARVKIRDKAQVIHLAVDPFFNRYPMHNFRCDVPLAAEPEVTLPLLADAVRKRVKKREVKARHQTLAKRHTAARRKWDKAALAEAKRIPIGFQWASRCINELLGPNTIVFNEYPLDPRFAPPAGPGTYFGASHAGGLGWGFGAALGAKLGAPGKTVICTLGDGSYIFGVPTACHQVARASNLPLLTIIFNNGTWDEVSNSTRNVHPDGWAVTTDNFPMVSMGPPPKFEEIVRAFDGHGERVEDPAELPAALKRALNVVRKEKRQALVNIICKR
ncbi:MAG: thiamine pyrophosphate-requiring protein [Rhodospirillales bacterium]|nr:thiamine pyrophosphate-requiring protein [Rhodospirillales bacterium]